jgi:hypothetical protein
VWGRSLLQMLAEAGFVEGRIHGWTDYRTSSCTEGALITARKPALADREFMKRRIINLWNELTQPVPTGRFDLK